MNDKYFSFIMLFKNIDIEENNKNYQTSFFIVALI